MRAFINSVFSCKCILWRSRLVLFELRGYNILACCFKIVIERSVSSTLLLVWLMINYAALSLGCFMFWRCFQNVEQIVRFLKVEKYSPNKTRFLHLKPCGHVVEVNYMDQWVEGSKPTPPTSPQYVTCPICKQMVGLCPRSVCIQIHAVP